MTDTQDEVKAHAEQLSAEKGRTVHAFEAYDTTFYLMAPNRAVWQRFRDASVDPDKRTKALDRLALDCLVEPDAKAFKALLEELPGLPETLSKPIAELAGASGKIEKKA